MIELLVLNHRGRSIQSVESATDIRLGVTTSLHALGVADKQLQTMLRHSNISVTHNCYIKALAESQVRAMELLGEELEKVRESVERPCLNHQTSFD